MEGTARSEYEVGPWEKQKAALGTAAAAAAAAAARLALEIARVKMEKLIAKQTAARAKAAEEAEKARQAAQRAAQKVQQAAQKAQQEAQRREPTAVHRTAEGRLAVLSDRHFLLVDVQEHRDRSHIYYIESAPLGRLRAVITRADGRGAGGFTLDFAGPVFEGRTGYGSGMQIQYEEREGWASEDVSAFLAAIVAARR